MRYALPVFFLIGLLTSCSDSKTPVQASDVSNTSVASTTPILPTLSKDQLATLLNACTQIDYFYNSMNMTTSAQGNQVKAHYGFFLDAPVTQMCNYEPLSTAIFLNESGDVLAQAAIFFVEDCSYAVLQIDSAQYAHPLSPHAQQFYKGHYDAMQQSQAEYQRQQQAQ